jgi:heterodisulfide reductase subunit B
MDRIVGALGARPLDWNGKTVCCGASLALTRTDCVRKLVGDILRDARRAGADAVAVACPLCQANLDARQEAAGEEGGIPILYFSQLMGLAFGAEAGTLGLQRLLVSPLPMLSRLGLT